MSTAGGAAPPKRRRRKRLPEEVDTGHAAAHYAGGEAERYTAHNAATQLDLTLACARLLGLDAGAPPGSLILDAGCGSGLSARALAAAPFRAAVVGFDVSPAMLAAVEPSTTPADPCVLADAGARWPVRPRAADGVVSVSVAQWLLVSPDPPAALTAFFTSLITSLKPGAGAIAQIYARTDAATDALAAAARRAGAAAALLVDVPHATPARKTFLAMVAPTAAAGQSPAFAAAAAGPPHDCPAAWPRARTSCALWWRAAVVPQLVAAGKGPLCLPPDAHARLRDEHARLALRLARVVRRARGDCLPNASRRLEAWPPCPGANACGVPVLVSVLCEGGSGLDAAALGAALGCERVTEGAAPRPASSTAAAASKPPAITLAPTADPDVSTLSASVAAVAGFLVASVAETEEGDAAAAIASATTTAASVAAAASIGLYLVAADVDASGRVTVIAAWHAKNAGAGEEDVKRVGAAVRERRKELDQNRK